MTADPAIDYEAEYNNRRRVPEYPEIAERWALLANAYRLAADTELDQPYGARERQRYDLFHAADRAGAPLVVYIHGGYWQRGDRKDYSFVARELNANGVTVAGPLNLASQGAVHASEMYARNVLNFVALFVKDGALQFDWDDELLARTVWPERPAVVANAAA